MATLSQWRDAFLSAGEAALTVKPTSGEALETKVLRTRVGEPLIELALLEEKIAMPEARHPLARAAELIEAHGQAMICFLKTGPFGIGIFRVFSLGLGGTRDDEGIEIFGRAEGVHIEAGHGGVPVAEICRRAGISQATHFNRKKKYEGLSPPEMRHLKRLEEENAKLRKLVADLSLDREMLQDVIRRKL